MEIGDKAIWTGANPKGWAGNGACQILDAEWKRPFFPGEVVDGVPRGPAVCIQMDHNGLTCWVEPGELQPR